MRRKNIIGICVCVCFCYLMLSGCVIVNNYSYEERTEEGSEMEEEGSEEKSRGSAEREERSEESMGTYFENFHSEIRRKKFKVSGTANLAEGDENAILAEFDVKEKTKVRIVGDIQYKEGGAEIYLLSPDDEKNCILSQSEIEENGQVEKTVELEEGYNRFFLKGDNSIIEFDLEFVSDDIFDMMMEDLFAF